MDRLGRLDSQTARHVERITTLSGYVVHGMFPLGGSSDSIDPRLDQCRRLCCDMASTASTANFIHPLKEASRLNLSPIRGPPTRPTTALGLARPRRQVFLVLLHTNLLTTRSSTTSTTSPLILPACDLPIRPAHTHIRYPIPRSLSQRRHRSEPAAPSSISASPRHQRTFVSPRPPDTTPRPHGTPLEHSPSVQTGMGL